MTRYELSFCQECGGTHEAVPSYVRDDGRQVFEVVCTDWLSDYYTDEVVVEIND